MTVIATLLKWSATAPDMPALSDFANRRRNYRELVTDIQALAAAIGRVGIGRTDRVALALPNGMEAAVGFLGASAAATAAPLNPDLTSNEYAFLLRDLRARLLIVGGEEPAAAIAAARGLGLPVMAMSLSDRAGIAIDGRLTPSNESVDLQRVESDDVALVLHTSGTTARPKLVPLTHRKLEFSALNISGVLRLGPTDRCLNLMPLFHIHGIVGCLLTSLVAGGETVCPPKFNIGNFSEWLFVANPTWFSAVPSIHARIVEVMASDSDVVGSWKNRPRWLRFIRSCSSALPRQLWSELGKVFQVPVIEAYGMTEASHQIASNPLPPGVQKPGSVGLSFGTHISIVGETGDELPAGIEGEVTVRSDGLIAGYDENPEATRSAFTNGWFRTGDSGYLDSDGYLYLSGRIKELINRGGEKIAPREVEEVALEHADVIEAVAYPVPHAMLGEEVGLAVVLRRGSATDVPELRNYLRPRLAHFKLPRYVGVLDELPKGATGKIRRRFVASELTDRGIDLNSAVPSRPPADGIESDLASVVASVTEAGAVGATDDFLAVGVDSLKAARIIAQIANDYGIEFTLVEFFKLATVEQVALALTLRIVESRSPEEVLGILDESGNGEV